MNKQDTDVTIKVLLSRRNRKNQNSRIVIDENCSALFAIPGRVALIQCKGSLREIFACWQIFEKNQCRAARRVFESFCQHSTAEEGLYECTTLSLSLSLSASLVLPVRKATKVICNTVATKTKQDYLYEVIFNFPVRSRADFRIYARGPPLRQVQRGYLLFATVLKFKTRRRATEGGKNRCSIFFGSQRVHL